MDDKQDAKSGSYPNKMIGVNRRKLHPEYFTSSKDKYLVLILLTWIPTGNADSTSIVKFQTNCAVIIIISIYKNFWMQFLVQNILLQSYVRNTSPRQFSWHKDQWYFQVWNYGIPATCFSSQTNILPRVSAQPAYYNLNKINLSSSKDLIHLFMWAKGSNYQTITKMFLNINIWEVMFSTLCNGWQFSSSNLPNVYDCDFNRNKLQSTRSVCNPGVENWQKSQKGALALPGNTIDWMSAVQGLLIIGGKQWTAQKGR